jgi:hypothetical protein
MVARLEDAGLNLLDLAKREIGGEAFPWVAAGRRQ